MSERGSFVTSYIYCPLCLAAAQAVLLRQDSGLNSAQMPVVDEGRMHPIIAGKVGGLFGGEELLVFEYALIPQLERTICHPLRIAVLAERGEAIFTVEPKA